jgi:uncharacterized protein (TIGR04255 family)
MTWKPINEEHSIELVRLVLSFAPSLAEKATKTICECFGSVLASEGFTPSGDIVTQNVQLGDVPSKFKADLSEQFFGRRFLRGSHGGLPAEALEVRQDSISYESKQYDSWPRFLSNVVDVVLPIGTDFFKLTDISSVSLEYFDRYIFDGRPELATPGSLLNNLAGRLHSDAISGKEIWHIHRGWFETEKKFRYLVNQNFKATNGKVNNSETVRSIEVFTKVEAQLGPNFTDFGMINEYLDDMHDRSKVLVSEILNDEMVEKVGLNK